MFLLPRTNTSRRGAVVAVLVAIVVILTGAPGASAAGWEWEIVPYVWFTDVGIDVSMNESDIASTTIDFSDLIANANMAALVHFEGRKGRGGLFVDAVYMSLSDDNTTSGGPPIPAGTMTDSDLDQLILEGGGVYRLTGDEQGLDLLFGVRVLDVSLDVDIDFPEGSLIADRSRASDNTLLDGFVGLRYGQDISDRWLWSIRGDIGAGDTDLTWHGVLTFGMQYGKKGNKTLYAGYRHLSYEFEEGTNGITKQEIDFSGPAVGFGFAF